LRVFAFKSILVRAALAGVILVTRPVRISGWIVCALNRLALSRILDGIVSDAGISVTRLFRMGGASGDRAGEQEDGKSRADGRSHHSHSILLCLLQRLIVFSEPFYPAAFLFHSVLHIAMGGQDDALTDRRVKEQTSILPRPPLLSP
jgi:hypothetical protein